MTDDLRHRIACVLAGITPNNSPRRKYVEMADAVIEELGLQPEYCVRHQSGGGRIYHDRNQAHHQYNTFVERPPGVEDPGSGKLTGVENRWVTEWATD